METKKSQDGFAIAQVLVAISLAVVAGSLAYSYSMTTRATADAAAKTRASDAMKQAMTSLNNESVMDSDGAPNAPAPTGYSSVGPVDGTIPATSGAPKSDSWGTLFRYCAWDNGATQNTATRSAGVAVPLQTSLVFAVISAGPNKIMETSCANIKAGVVNGDDGYRSMMISQARQGVGGTVYYGDPVQCFSATDPDAAFCGTSLSRLDLLTAGGYVPKVGENRVVSRSNSVAQWTGAAWVYATPKLPVFTEGNGCGTYGPNSMGTDGAGGVLVCQ